jgi:putative redox protein
MKINLIRKNKACHFEATNEEGRSIELDSSPSSLGEGLGVRPMQSLLMALGGCTAIDITLILTKQKLEILDFKLEIEGEREEHKEPALWTKIHIDYHIRGNMEQAMVERAVHLSMTKYCSVAETLRRAGAVISYTIFLKP